MATTTTQPTTLSDVIGFITGATGDRDRASGAGPVLQGGGSRVMTGGVQGSVTGVLARLYGA